MTLVRLLDYHLPNSGLKKEHQIHRQTCRVSEFKSTPSRIIDVTLPSKHLEKFSRRFANDDAEWNVHFYEGNLLPVYLCYDSVSLKFLLVVCKAWTPVIFKLTEIQMKNYSASCIEKPPENDFWNPNNRITYSRSSQESLKFDRCIPPWGNSAWQAEAVLCAREKPVGQI